MTSYYAHNTVLNIIENTLKIKEREHHKIIGRFVI